MYYFNILRPSLDQQDVYNVNSMSSSVLLDSIDHADVNCYFNIVRPSLDQKDVCNVNSMTSSALPESLDHADVNDVGAMTSLLKFKQPVKEFKMAITDNSNFSDS